MLKKFWEGWKKFGHFMGDLLARIVLTVFYFTIFLPFGLLVSLFGDPLDIKSPKSFWLKRTQKEDNLEAARKLS